MTPRAVGVAAVVLAGVAAVGVWVGGRARSSGPVVHRVEIHDMAFEPAALDVRPGDTVIWINHDLVPHTVTAADSSWGSPPLADGERWTRVVPTGSVGRYACRFHPTMEGRLVVPGAR